MDIPKKDMERLNHHINEVAKILGLAEPYGFMLSYEMGDMWIDIYLEKTDSEWTNKTYTLSIPIQKKEKLLSILSNSESVYPEMVSDSERIYVTLSEEEWEKLYDNFINLF